MTLLRDLVTAAVSLHRLRQHSKSPRDAGRPDVVVLRTNPKDSSLPRLLTILLERYRVAAVVWDRGADYVCPINNPNLTIVRSTRRGEYYRLSTVLSVASLQPWFLARALRLRPRAVHAMDLDTGVIGLLAARILRVPFVYQCLDPYAASLPDGWPPGIARVVGRIEDAVITAADLFVITDIKRLPQHPGAHPRHLLELPNIPMSSIRPHPFSNTGLVVGYIGSLVPHRSLELMIDTIGQLSDKGVRLVVGGFGPLENALRERAERYRNVSFLGWVPEEEVLNTMGSFDVFVQVEDPAHPAYRWVSPNKVFESMAFGRPIIVASGTLAAERVSESGHGVTVEFGNAEALKQAVTCLASDRAQLHELGRRGAEAFRARWAPAAVTSRALEAVSFTVAALTSDAAWETGPEPALPKDGPQ